MFQVDFYESGIGETTIVTFPDNSIGVIDAYPSACDKRPDIDSLTSGKKVRFVCLSHPHHDHAKDLASVIEHSNPDEFWHTVRTIKSYFYKASEYSQYVSPVNPYVQKRYTEAVQSLTSLFGTAKKKRITQSTISNETMGKDIAGVRISFLAPDTKTLSNYEYDLDNRIRAQKGNPPDPNGISSIIAFEYGEHVFIHGGDALAQEWIKVCKTKRITANLMKVPHHGADNALFVLGNRSPHNYRKLFNQQSNLIIFGNATHPSRLVWKELNNKSKNIYFLLNQYHPSSAANNPLGITGGRLISKKMDDLLCNSHIHVEWDISGGIRITQGTSCLACPHNCPL